MLEAHRFGDLGVVPAGLKEPRDLGIAQPPPRALDLAQERREGLGLATRELRRRPASRVQAHAGGHVGRRHVRRRSDQAKAALPFGGAGLGRTQIAHVVDQAACRIHMLSRHVQGRAPGQASNDLVIVHCFWNRYLRRALSASDYPCAVSDGGHLRNQPAHRAEKPDNICHNIHYRIFSRTRVIA